MRGHHHRRRFPGEETEPGERSTTRVQLEMPPQAMERLQKLKDRTEAASYAEVVKNALRLYEALIEETEAGKQFFVRDDTGAMAPYRLFL